MISSARTGYNPRTLNAIFTVPVVLSALVTAAHFLRWGQPAIAAASLLAVSLLLVRRPWARLSLFALLMAAAFCWLGTALDLLRARLAMGESFFRMTAILATVTAFVTASGALLLTPFARRHFGGNGGWPQFAAFLITAVLLGVIQRVVDPPLLLLERFVPGGGWAQILALAVYAGFVSDGMSSPKRAPAWRRRVWLLFSAVFFGQLALGVLGLDRFLMSGDLHLPVPAMIIAGPIFRGEGLFMPILFASTAIVVGPAWCSHLCYIGAIDQLAAGRGGRPSDLPRWTRHARVAILILIVAAAIGLRAAGVPGLHAAALGLAFGLAGIGLMIAVSRRLGVMVHCVVWCPIGLAANLLGKISPFRITFNGDCNGCRACSLACRFDALRAEQIDRREVGLTCTLCGDCLAACSRSALEYTFYGRASRLARPAFVALAVALHAVCLCVARI